MPNRPDDPYARFPFGAAVGLFFMVAGGVALLILSGTWRDWRQAALGALILLALIGLVMALRRFTPRLSTMIRPNDTVPPRPDVPPPPFDPAGFVETVRRRHPAASPRQIERPQAEEEGRGLRSSRAIGVDTIRRLQDLRDHPATPAAERDAADEKLKKTRTKRRSAWRKGA